MYLRKGTKRMTKKWWHDKTVYQIYPKSFCDSNGDGIGDIPGIISKLDYLKELGIGIIWLCPCYASPRVDEGYDISDYYDIDPRFGTLADMDRLIAEAKKRGISIVMDLVVNHTSDQHEWFVESRKSKDNPYRDFYIWQEGKDERTPPNNWGACFGGSAWQYDPQTGMYYLHLFTPEQPDLNWDNPRVRREVFDMMAWWCDRGIGGFRMDVISMISKTKEKPDGEIKGLYGDYSPYCVHGPHVHEYLQEMNREVLSKYDIMTVGETSGVTIEQAERYAGKDSHELDMVFQFEHVEGYGKYGRWTDERIPLTLLKKILSKWQTQLHGKVWNSLFWGNHDQPRAVSAFGNDSPRCRVVSAKMLAICLHMMQGTPYIYQGEELGMTNYPFRSMEEFRDVESINAYREWCESGILPHEVFWPCLLEKSRDNARTPMQWDDSENAGFTAGTPWISVNPNYREINAEAVLKDPDSVFYCYKKLVALRKEYPLIVDGSFELLLADSEELFVYKRMLEHEKLLTVCNFTDRQVEFDVPEEFDGAECLIANMDGRRQGHVMLAPYESFVLYKG